jgi:ABC-type transport system involved in cytochrome c biogenesis permease subunit
LQRPPVANMFETVIYVPWIAVLSSLAFGYYFRSFIILGAANIVCLILLIVLKITKINNSLEAVQAVLNSNYWLTIHVLLVVGSYGLFCLSGILGHFYLISYCLYPCQLAFRTSVGKLIRQSMFFGLIFLIAGTILGGVWAAESWGRFWDWDPKESWAFISICVYLIWIHAYMFKHIGDAGLAVGSIMGLQAISFTWYGVNYILGTGLHSYGFGSGGEYFYYLFLIGETLFLLWVLGKARSQITP